MPTAEDYQIADCEDTHYAPSYDQCVANAHFIVTACNSHTELLEACKRFVENSPCTNGCGKNDMTCDTQFAIQAIAKAEGR